MGTAMWYDSGITDMLKRDDVTLDELKETRARAREFVKSYGNLPGALIELDEEIERRTSRIPAAGP